MSDTIRSVQKKRGAYREVFGSLAGRAVLADILVDCDFFSSEPDPTRIALAHGILERLGVFHSANIDRVVDALVATANDEDLRESFGEGGDE